MQAIHCRIFGRKQKKCGNKNCRCANGGDPHGAHILTKRENGKTKTIYVPVDMVEEVDRFSREYTKVKELIREIDQLSEKVILATKKRKKAAIRVLVFSNIPAPLQEGVSENQLTEMYESYVSALNAALDFASG